MAGLQPSSSFKILKQTEKKSEGSDRIENDPKKNQPVPEGNILG